jgi:septal ring factor EnvC (AmiA/AmiB activator)
MLQDLDHLSARIGQLVQLTRQLQAERDTLRTSLDQSQAAQRTLEQRCQAHETEVRTLQTKLQEHDGAVDDLLAEARQGEIDLRAQLARAISEQQAIETRAKAREAELLNSLSAKDTELQRLRVATEAARERIDTVLARLPGAPAPEPLSGAQP